MTGGAVLAADRVLPQERAAFLRLARGAGFIDRVALAQQLDVLGSVRIVTGGALHLSFTDRHMRGLVHLAHLLAMTLHAGLGDRAGLETRLVRLGLVHAVARRTRHVARVVLAPVPLVVLAPVVTGGAKFGDLVGLQLGGTLDVTVAAGVHMRLPGAVTTLTSLPRRGRARVGRASVRRALVALVLVFVTSQTDVGARVLAWRCRGTWRLDGLRHRCDRRSGGGLAGLLAGGRRHRRDRHHYQKPDQGSRANRHARAEALREPSHRFLLAPTFADKGS